MTQNRKSRSEKLDLEKLKAIRGDLKTPEILKHKLQHKLQAARHMLGLQQASFAGGPGKRKRSGQEEIRRGMGPVIIAVPVQEE